MKFFTSGLISARRLCRLIENAFALSIISVFRSKICPVELRNVKTSVTSEILRFSNQYPRK